MDVYNTQCVRKENIFLSYQKFFSSHYLVKESVSIFKKQAHSWAQLFQAWTPDREGFFFIIS